MDGTLATERDVEEGRAVFFLGNPRKVPAQPSTIRLPALALWPDSDGGSHRQVIVIQVEIGRQEIAGIRFLEGGNGVCLLRELEFIDDTDRRWRGV
ncbi:MAG TPA: hypothetical protein VLA79_11750 [Polyangia bacterium]|nr:hypothetical protein [Polyangia bacterium]